MRALITAFILCVTILTVSAQKIHTINEIFELMDTSEITYSVEMGDVEPIDYSQFVLNNDFYVKVDGNTQSVYQYEPNDSAIFYMEIAESYFNKSDMDQARDYYIKTLNADPTYFKAMVYLGDTYYHQQRYSEALSWYQKAIDSNYVDYLAHWACANAYVYLGNLDKALREITIAKVLNRNNSRLTSRLKVIYNMCKKDYVDWYFSPIYSVYEDYDKQNDKIVVKIKFKDYWMLYALAKAVWKYEPGYAEAMGNNLVMGEKEAIAAYMYEANSNKDAKKAIATKVLYKTLKTPYPEDYIVYEAILPSNPEVAMYLGKEGVERIATYVLDVRSQVKK